jgi:hypothetical protein
VSRTPSLGVPTTRLAWPGRNIRPCGLCAGLVRSYGGGVHIRPMTLPQIGDATGDAAFLADRDMALDHDHCFLCGVELIAGNRTEEHVFPRWMQREYDLWTQRLTLLNGTTIQYRSLTIPCCEDCNTFWLSQIEDVVAPAFRAGPDAVRALDPSLLCLWLSKVYYGIHFKEIALPPDRRDPGGLTIGSPAALARFRELHLVMQAMRKRVLFGGPPGSLRIFRAQVPGEARHRFDYKDLRDVPFLGLRAGATVVLGALLDWGAMAGATAATFTAAEELELHPSQSEEVAAFALQRDEVQPGVRVPRHTSRRP